MAFHKRKFPLVSFSCGGDLRDPAVVLDEDGAKVEDREVVSAPEVPDSDAAVVVDMISIEGGSLMRYLGGS